MKGFRPFRPTQTLGASGYSREVPWSDLPRAVCGVLVLCGRSALPKASDLAALPNACQVAPSTLAGDASSVA
jgi:hypothetical protein